MPSHVSHSPSVAQPQGRNPRDRHPWHAAAVRLLLAGLVLLSHVAIVAAQADPRRQFGRWSAPRSSWFQNAPQRPHPAVVRIVAPERNGTSLGSGTLVDVRGDYGLVLTNWHVVSDATGVITVVFPDGFRTAAQLVKADRVWDLAALAIWKPNAAPVALASSPPQPGEPLTIAGYGSGDYRAATARCTQYVAPAMNQPYEMVEVGTAARQGDSGGPIFNSRGELAGVLFGAGYGTTSGSYSGRVRGFLESVLPAGNASPDNSTIAARSSEQATRLSAVVPGDRGSSGARQPSSAAGYDRSMRGHASAAGSPSNVVSSAGQAAPPGGNSVATPRGGSPFAQIKTFLAVVGGAAFVLQALKLLRPRPKPEVTVENGETAKSGRGKAKR